MKKIILLILSLFTGGLKAESNYLLNFQEKRGVVCSVCGRSLIDEDFLYESKKGYSSTTSLLCRFCSKKIRGKGDEGKEVAPFTASAKKASFDYAAGDQSSCVVERIPSMVALATAGRRRHMVLLREARTGSERKDKELLKKLMEEEAEVAQEYMWKYRVVDDHTMEAENGLRKIQCAVKTPLKEVWYKGSCLVLVSENGYQLHDFYASHTEHFSCQEHDRLQDYLKRHQSGAEFRVYNFALFPHREGLSGKGPKKSILMSEEKRESLHKRQAQREKAYKESLGKSSRVIFADETRSSVPLTDSVYKFPFHYATEPGRNTLLVGNKEGYILRLPIGQPIMSVFARDTQAVIVTQEKGHTQQIWHDFSRHNEEDMVLAEKYPLAVLEAPLQSQEELEAQGFVKFPVAEKTFDQMFHEMAVIPEGFAHTIHPVSSLEELTRKLERDENRVLGEENDRYRCLLDARKSKVDIEIQCKKEDEGDEDDEDDEVDGFEITINNPRDRIWKRGSEVGLPDNGCFVVYDFKRETVERFPVFSMDSLEKELSKLDFTEVLPKRERK